MRQQTEYSSRHIHLISSYGTTAREKNYITRLQHNNIIMAINHRKKKKSKVSSSRKYQIEKIIDDKLDNDGVKTLYKTRWVGCTADDDTWEPTENVASTGVSYYLYDIYFSMHVLYLAM